MRFGMFHIFVNFIPAIVIETHWKRNYVPPEYIGIDFIFQVDVRIILEFLEMRRGKKRKTVTFERLPGERIHHLNQGAVQHLYGVCTFPDQISINFFIGTIAQRGRNMLRITKSDLFELASYRPLKNIGGLRIRQTFLHKTGNDSVNPVCNLTGRRHDYFPRSSLSSAKSSLKSS